MSDGLNADPSLVPKPRKRTIGLAVVLGATLIAVAAAWTYIAVKGGIVPAFESLPFVQPDLQAVFHKEKLHVLVLGIDDNWTANDEEYTANSRSDTTIAVAVDLITKNVSVVSIPRDLWVDIPKEGYDKLNAAYADAGPERTEAALVNNLGMPPFDYYVVLNMNATKNIVDAIGGIDMYVEKDMDYDDSWG
ncbi:MAG TPA: LCP family protein, partial [Candidatus Eremiobacteraceae bacterium]|nr:LCP family protein [Candidatus Eremiobacteraceae bacterium]